MGHRLIVGVGNPGAEYAGTRHNVGFQCLDALAGAHRVSFTKRQEKALVGTGNIEGVPVVLAKPMTFMNLSGVAVAGLARRWKVPPPDIFVIYDDMDLPFGKIRIRERGSSGGHKGIQSIIAEIGTDDFPRLRVGIGRPQDSDSIDHVLSEFTQAESSELKDVYAKAVAAVETVLREGLPPAINRFNR